MPTRRPWLVLTLIAALLVGCIGATPAPAIAALPLVEDFEAPLASGTDPNNIPVGWFNAQDGGSSVSFSREAAPAARPGAPSPNNVLRTTMNVQAFGVVIHAFENSGANAWVTQDWSAFLGFSLWVYGENTGTDLFLDIIDNRSAGSTRDDAERYSVSFKDNFSGWQKLQFPFDSFTRKEIGNGAPSDGFTLSEVHGWAFGALSTGGTARTWYVDDVELYGVAPVRPLTVGFGGAASATEGESATVSVKLSKASDAPVTVQYATADGSATAGRDYTPAAGTLTFAPGVREQTFNVPLVDDGKWEGNETILLTLSAATGAEFGVARTARIDVRENDTFDPNLIDDFERAPELYTSNSPLGVRSLELAPGDPMALPGQQGYERVLTTKPSSQAFLPFVAAGRASTAPAQPSTPAISRTTQISRTFAASEDWSGATGLSMWLYGRNSGQDLTLTIHENRAVDPGPAGWQLVWSDEFNRGAGAPPNPEIWGYEIGDGSVNSIPGWGNSELQYYTDSRENVAHDGQGNLAITVRANEDESLLCYYGPCEYTSARLLTQHKQEFGYGRIEARAKVPGGAGLWPAFWSLGNDIGRVGWPQTGEIDIMEFVGRVPNEIFGTIHGPGYSGGNAFGDTYTFNEPVPNAYHTYTIEWQPNLIVWYVDGIEYHRATPADVAPNEWVFDHAFFLLLNIAVGGNFGGAVSPDTVFPATMQVDYVRVYAGADSAERFSASVKDDFSGWKKVTLPISAFSRSAQQPAGAPNDGLNLREVWGFDITQRGAAPLFIDQLRLEGRQPPKTQMTLPVTFDSPTVSYGLVGFGGAEDSTIVADPTDPSNKVAKVVKSATAELWAGTTLTDDGTRGFASKIPFAANSTKMTVRVWSPDAGIKVRLKVEDAADPTKSVETEATTTLAGAWETLTFDFASHAAGTPALNLATTYNKASIFFNFGVTGATAGAKTYYFDDVAFGPASGGGGTWSPITFDAGDVTYTLTGFGGAEDSTVVADPTNASNKVAKVVKSATAELWAGTTVSTGPNNTIPALPFSAISTTMTVRVWSPDDGIKVRLKVEDAADPTKSVETEATTTLAGAWETLTFNFANHVNGTPALNLATTYNRVSIFFNFGTTGATAGAKTYYFDDLTFGGTSGGGGGGDTWSPITFDAGDITYTLTGFGGAEDSTVVADPTNASNKVAKVVKSATAELWAGTTVSTGPNNTIPALPFSAISTTMTVRVWSPDAGIKVRLKVEDATDPTKSVETEATTTVAGAWETLTFNFANHVNGTSALNLATTYNRVSIFFNFGTTGATAGAKTYYFDDLAFGP